MTNKEKFFTVGSLFSGIGGICTGFTNAGYNIKWANDFDKKACETYRYNYTHKLYEQDINTVIDPKTWGYVDVITSGFPCQAFSVAGYREGFKDKKGRGNLFFETARFIKELKPKAYLLENVKNLINHDKGKTLEVIKDTLTKSLNYSFIPFILNSKDCGNVPQTRERIYIVGFKNEGHIIAELNKGINSNLNNSLSSKFIIPCQIPLTKKVTDIIDKSILDDNYYYDQSHKYYPELKKSMVREDTVYQWRRTYVRENKSNLCPTLTANMGTGGHNVPLVKVGDKYRKLTPIECLIFQGFDTSKFKFPENMANSHRYKQIGNSVVIPVIERIALNMKEVLSIESCQK